MSKDKEIIYVEKFLFRTRTHKLTDAGIRTIQDNFLESSETFHRIESLGHLLHYKSDLRIGELIIVPFFIFIGSKGLMRKFDDQLALVISFAFIGIALYMFYTILFRLKYVGSYYFSHHIDKAENAFEIKSKYPASVALENFIKEIRERQKKSAKTDLIDGIYYEQNQYDLKQRAENLKNIFEMTAEEYSSFCDAIDERMKEVKKNNMQNKFD